MTAPAKNDRDASLDAAGKRHMMEIRARRALTVAITNESWGKTMSPVMRQAFAEYMRRFRLDISEVDNLGGKPYRNGNYYKRKIAELRAQGRVEWSEGEFLHHDARLDLMAESDDPETAAYGKNEALRRLKERIRLAVPVDATVAYVVRVKLKSDGKAQEGADWIQPTKMKKVKEWENGKFVGWTEKPADPVGVEEPEKTAVTRAWRRAGLLVAAEIPELRQEEEIMDAEAEVVEAEVQTVAMQEAAREEAAKFTATPMDAPPPNDPYQLGAGPAPDFTAKTPAREPVSIDHRAPLDEIELDAQRFDDDGL